MRPGCRGSADIFRDFAEQVLTAGVPLHVTSKWMGHPRVELTSKRYGNYAPDNASQWDDAAARS